MPLCCSQFSTIWLDTRQSKAFSISNKSRNNLPEKHGPILYWSSPWYFLFNRDRILLKINLCPVSDWNTKLFQPYFKPGPKFPSCHLNERGLFPWINAWQVIPNFGQNYSWYTIIFSFFTVHMFTLENLVWIN